MRSVLQFLALVVILVAPCLLNAQNLRMEAPAFRALDPNAILVEPPPPLSMKAGDCSGNEFGSTLCRVTDDADGDCHHEYVDRSPTNIDDTLMVVNCGNAAGYGLFLVNLTGTPRHRIGRPVPMPYEPGLSLSSAYYQWDPAKPGRLWMTSKRKLVRLDVKIPFTGPGKYTVVHDFDGKGPKAIDIQDRIFEYGPCAASRENLFLKLMGIAASGRMTLDIECQSKAAFGVVQYDYLTNTVVRVDLGLRPKGLDETWFNIGQNQGVGRALDWITVSYDCPSREWSPHCVSSRLTRVVATKWGESPFTANGKIISGNFQQVHSAILDSTSVRCATNEDFLPIKGPITGDDTMKSIISASLDGTPNPSDANRLPFVRMFGWPSKSQQGGCHISANALTGNTVTVSLYDEGTNKHGPDPWSNLIFDMDPHSALKYDAKTKLWTNPSTARRLSWNWTYGASTAGFYWRTPRASQGISGKYAVFTSGLCRNAQECGVRNKSAVFLVTRD